jgi:hypothetical protein
MGMVLACDKVNAAGERCKSTAKDVALVEHHGIWGLNWRILPGSVTCPTCQDVERESGH